MCTQYNNRVPTEVAHYRYSLNHFADQQYSHNKRSTPAHHHNPQTRKYIEHKFYIRTAQVINR